MRQGNTPLVPPKLYLDRISKEIIYNPITGKINKVVWLQKGYEVCKIYNKNFKIHHIAYYKMTNKWPPLQINHKDNIKSNNMWNNLELATDTENQLKSSTIRSSNTSGYIGVSLHKQNRNWLWHLQMNYQPIRKYGFKCSTSAAIDRDKYIIKNNLEVNRNIL